MLASVHLADVNARTQLAVLRRAPSPASVPGLLSARVAVATPLRTSLAPKLAFGRVAMVSFWGDDESLDAFESHHSLAPAFANGWRARLEPLRAFGAWPGLDSDVPRKRRVEFDGPVGVLTLGRVHASRVVSFLRTSAKAEAATVGAPGSIWATAMARPPFFATFSLWTSSEAIASYAFDNQDGAHPAAIRADRAKPFHHESAFIRFRPYGVTGDLGGKNPLPATAFT